MTCFSDVFIQQITCICANNAVNKKKSSIQKQWAALSGLEKTKENCRHASAETSKAFSLQGKYLKANIQLTLLLLQTPVTSRCAILACRVVQRHTDRCLDKNIFLYSRQDAFGRKRSDTAPGGGGGQTDLLIRDHLKSWDLLANSLAVGLLCRGSRQLAVPALINHFDFSGILFLLLLFICCKSSKNQSIIYRGFQIFLCKYLQRHWRTGSMLGGNIDTKPTGIDPLLQPKGKKKRLSIIDLTGEVLTMTPRLQGRCSQFDGALKYNGQRG